MIIQPLARVLYAAWWAESVGRGWRPIVAPVVLGILERGAHPAQIKEKFGGLRLYWDFDDPERYDAEDWEGNHHLIDGLVRMAEWACWRICEHCGTTQGVTTKGGWLKTLCRECHGLSLHEITPAKYGHVWERIANEIYAKCINIALEAGAVDIASAISKERVADDLSAEAQRLQLGRLPRRR